jgi:hypothetical protein
MVPRMHIACDLYLQCIIPRSTGVTVKAFLVSRRNGLFTSHFEYARCAQGRDNFSWLTEIVFVADEDIAWSRNSRTQPFESYVLDDAFCRLNNTSVMGLFHACVCM